jgi:hypothetical protein
MWDKDDHFGRWVQAFCAVPLLVIAAILIYLALSASRGLRGCYYGGGRLFGGALVCLALSGRCLWYAATGKNNVNRDDY